MSAVQETSIAPSLPEIAEIERLSEALGVPLAGNLNDASASQEFPSASEEFVDRIPIAFARAYKVLGLAAEGPVLPVLIADAAGLAKVEIVSRLLNRPTRPLLASEDQIVSAVNRGYQQQAGAARTMIDSLDRSQVLTDLAEMSGREDLLDVASRAPVIRLVNLLLFEAVQGGASDVHLQPYEGKLIVRMRIDGVLYNAFDLPKNLQDEIVSRVKVMGRMNIAEKRLPQDGRATVEVGDGSIDLRIATLPTSFGERVVIRLLDKSARLYTLQELGMSPPTLAQFRRVILAEHGLILVTGPTGSGKSTTLYAVLQQLDHTEKNVLTLEDPIEFRLEGISQTQVSDKKGMTFASGLRSVLRQDPDVIMVGEIRDHETATMAIQSSLTGHEVFSTLHTNDAPSAITRLLDLGIEPYLLASSIVGVLAQRLVRRVCVSCAESRAPNPGELGSLGFDGAALWTSAAGLRRGAGCPVCRGTGYRGRLGLFELLVVDDAVRERIQSRANSTEIKAAAERNGMQNLRADGIAKALAGLTTPEEVARVTAD
jgi:general secretion pathway protein E